MSDRAVVALAAAAVVGARIAAPIPDVLVVLAVVAVVVVRRPWLAVAAAVLVASALGSRAWAGLDDAPIGAVEGTATMVSDPEPIPRGVRFDARIGPHRYEVVAFGAEAGPLRDLAAGERVELAGRSRASPEAEVAWLAPRHIGRELLVERVGAWSAGDPITRTANRLRRTLVEGAAALPDEQEALFAGFVLGDDRAQSPRVADDFRAAGLTHLLVVSGQNVAFVLAVAGPVLHRFALRGRFVLTLAVIGFFAMVTRFEPSVTRASAMAGLAALATLIAREASALRLLALAVAGLVLVDPLLAHSLGFGLSVGASAGIILLARPIARRLPGPGFLTSALGVTLGAQLGVAPLLIPAFGGIPLASLPANLLAVPAAGPLVAWGMTGGLVAGLGEPVFGEGWARLVHLPTGLLVGWIAGVARAASRLPLGEVGFAHLGVAVAGGAVIAAGRGLAGRSGAPGGGGRTLGGHGRGLPPPRLFAVVGGLLVGAAMVHAASGPWRDVPRSGRPTAGAEVWVGADGAAVLALDERARASPLLEGLRRGGVRRVALVVVRSFGGSRAGFDAVTAVLDRYRPPIVLAPRSLSLPDRPARPPPVGTSIRVDDIVVLVESVSHERLAVRVMARGPPGSPPPSGHAGARGARPCRPPVPARQRTTVAA
jgi:competence protein ComEC